MLRHYLASARLSVKSTTSIRFAVIRKDDTPTSAWPCTNMPIIPSQVPFFCEPVPPSTDFRKTLLWQSPRHDTTELINVRNTKQELNSLGLWRRQNSSVTSSSLSEFVHCLVFKEALTVSVFRQRKASNPVDLIAALRTRTALRDVRLPCEVDG